MKMGIAEVLEITLVVLLCLSPLFMCLAGAAVKFKACPDAKVSGT